MSRELFDRDELHLLKQALEDYARNFQPTSSYATSAREILRKIENEILWWNSGK